MKNRNIGTDTERANSKTSASVSSSHVSLALLVALAGIMLCTLVQAREFPPVIDLGNLDATEGFWLDGEKTGDSSGISVSAAGDVNGDGFDDLVVGAHTANPNGTAEDGRTYILYGRFGDFSSRILLSELDGTLGFKINGEKSLDWSGASVAGVGDFNGDDIDDIIIGAWGADPNGDRSGRSYVVFGSNSGFGTPVLLGDLNGNNGFKIDGEASLDRSGVSVAAAGDVNGDGFADVIIGANGKNGKSGRSYVVFGDVGTFSAREQLSLLDGDWGFSISGENILDNSGYSVSGAGDVNGDGYDDLIIGAFRASSAALDGRSYVVFGKDVGFEADVSLMDLDGSNGFRLDGPRDSEVGYSVSAAGDVNGDRIADLIIGAPGASHTGNRSGSAYVVYGTSTGFTPVVDLERLDVSEGFRLDGESNSDEAGSSVAGAGDINGDGIDDLVIGAPNANPVDGTSGRIYVVFGRRTDFPETLQLSSLDGTNGFKLNGENDGDAAGTSVSAAGDVNGDGRPDLIIGAYGNDANGETESGRSYVIYGRGAPTESDDEPQTGLFVDGFEPGS